MRQPLYIQSAVAISPQQSFSPEAFLRPMITSSSGKMYVLEAPYARYISPVAIRRMSRILKLTISTAMQCLQDAGVTTPDAIITGTGRGAVTDMETFVKDMILLDEGVLNPTLFIQSTYNSPNGWIAMQSSCTGYNQTYVHRGCSFELAVQDARMLATETKGKVQVLAGSYDELTEEYYLIRGKRGYWKSPPVSNGSLLEHQSTPGTIAGEGAAFFVLGNQPGGASAVIRDMRIVYGATASGLCESVLKVLGDAGLAERDISLVLTGLNGDSRQHGLYADTMALFPESVPVACFKHLCGEYDTASGFGLWLAHQLISKGVVPQEILLKSRACSGLQHILLINHYILGTASVWLLSATDV